MSRYTLALVAFAASLGSITVCFAQGSYDPAPSGNTQTEVYVGRDSVITMPGPDAGTVNGNQVDFDTPGAVPPGGPYDANPNNTAIIHEESPGR